MNFILLMLIIVVYSQQSIAVDRSELYGVFSQEELSDMYFEKSDLLQAEKLNKNVNLQDFIHCMSRKNETECLSRSEGQVYMIFLDDNSVRKIVYEYEKSNVKSVPVGTLALNGVELQFMQRLMVKVSKAKDELLRGHLPFELQNYKSKNLTDARKASPSSVRIRLTS
ncbi:hypothetical protein ACFO4O_06465 [Glaciecola siphonariae]|uniref:Uncharacterized protein n=1 Tax=Glaciecola siphonariae TaxID=521012 RepID=A0ABV9LU44_9ALTE